MQSTYLSRSLFGCTRISLISAAVLVGTMLVPVKGTAQQTRNSLQPAPTSESPGMDEQAGKATYPALLGLDASREEARRLVVFALACIPATVKEPAFLEALARYAVDRTH